jgi:hypothetical protein
MDESYNTKSEQFKKNSDNLTDKDPATVFLVYNEPDESIFRKWASWLIIMAVFLIILIYVTNYFANKSECFKINPSPFMHYRSKK